MKKILLLLTVLLALCSCTSRTKPEYPYEIVSKEVDMSEYRGVNSTRHNFRLVTVSQVFNVLDERSSGIFYLGRTNCDCCQKVTRYIQKAAQDLDVTVYYIDVYNEEESLMDEERYNELRDRLYEILNEEEGEKVLQTPTLFAIINGKISGSQICYDGLSFDSVPNEQQINALINVFKKIMEPFAGS